MRKKIDGSAQFIFPLLVYAIRVAHIVMHVGAHARIRTLLWLYVDRRHYYSAHHTVHSLGLRDSLSLAYVLVKNDL